MKKQVMLSLVCVMAFGCTYEGQSLKTYWENPKSIIQDPEFADYKAERDQLESQYLHRELSYAEYQEQVKELDAAYDQKVQKRTEIIESPY